MVEVTADMAARALVGAARALDFDPSQVFVPNKRGASQVRALAALSSAVALGGVRRRYAALFRVHPSELSKAHARAGAELQSLVEMLRRNAKSAHAGSGEGAATPDKIAPPPTPKATARRRKPKATPAPTPAPKALTVLPGRAAPSLKHPEYSRNGGPERAAGVPLDLGPGDDRLVARTLAAGGLPTAAVIEGRTVWLGPDNTEWRARA